MKTTILRDRGGTPLPVDMPCAVSAIEHTVGWVVDMPCRQIWWSAQAVSLFGTAGVMPSGLDAIVALCDPAGRAALRDHLEACASDGTPFDAKTTIVSKSGQTIPALVSARAFRDAEGTLTRVQGSLSWSEACRSVPSGTKEQPAGTGDTLGTPTRITSAGTSNPSSANFGRQVQNASPTVCRELHWEQSVAPTHTSPYYRLDCARSARPRSPFAEWFSWLPRSLGINGSDDDNWTATRENNWDHAYAQSALGEARRELQMLIHCNDAVVHAVDESDLIEQLCRIAVADGGYGTAWVGYARDNKQSSIDVVAHAGTPEDAINWDALALSWSAQDADGQGPAGLAIRSAAPVVVNDMENDCRFSIDASEARLGRVGAAFLPLKDGSRVFGLLALHGVRVADDNPKQIQLLQHLADNLAFGIATIRARRGQEKTQSAMIKVAASVTTIGGENFFEQLAMTMVEATGADGGVIARLLPGTPRMARTVIAVAEGRKIPDFSYLVDQSPCGRALDNGHYVVPDEVDSLFPDSPAAALKAKAYGGWRLHNSAGIPIGLATVMFRRPIERSEFVTSTLRIFAARAAAELERQEADSHLRTQASLLDQAQDAIIVRSLDDRILFWNSSAERMYGWSRAEALGRNIHLLLRDDEAEFADAKQIAIETGQWQGECVRHEKNGNPLTVQARLSLIRSDSGEPEAILSINTDISQRKAAEREIAKLAFYDTVTGLPNRQLLLDRLGHAMASAGRSGCSGALLFIDLDNFKNINDTLGHDLGDQMLVLVAQRLLGSVFEIDTVARFGGDEFVVLVEGISGLPHDAATQARHIGERLRVALESPMELDGYVLHSTASIGVTLFHGTQFSVNELLKQADLAMYDVKATGRNGLRFFDPEMEKVVSARAALEAGVRHALQHDEFLLHYQALVDRCGAVTGAEALIRWRSPERGLISPADFIPVAEATGLIIPVGRWVLEQVCAKLAHWATQPRLARLSIAVNVSAHQLSSQHFVDETLAILARAGARPDRLKLEITEGLLLNDTESVIAKMNALKAQGVSFSLDDFGTGYSSLSYLKRLPLDVLKIDRSFVDDVEFAERGAAIVQTILALGRCLHLTVVAEGVETSDQHSFLMEHGCDAFQGFYFSRPVPAETFENLVTE